MGIIPVRVILLMEPFALASAVRETLMVNSYLDVLIAGIDGEQRLRSGNRARSRPTVTVQLREYPMRFEVSLEGRRPAVESDSLEHVVRYLAAYAGDPAVWPPSGDLDMNVRDQMSLGTAAVRGGKADHHSAG